MQGNEPNLPAQWELAFAQARSWRDRLRADRGRGGMSDEVSWTAIIVGAAIAAATVVGAAVLAKAEGITF